MTDPGSHDDKQLVASVTDSRANDGELRFESNFSDMVSAGHINVAFEESSTDPLPNENFRENSCDLNGNANLPPSKEDLSETSPTETGVSISRPVVYDNRGGHSVVLQERVMTRLPDGTSSIQTRDIPDRGEQFQRPLRAKRITLIKIFSVIAAVIFFPTGIPAVYYAFKTKAAFDEGILQGNIDLAIKYITRAERLIICSIILAIVAGALALAMWERHVNSQSYTWHSGVIIGG